MVRFVDFATITTLVVVYCVFCTLTSVCAVSTAERNRIGKNDASINKKLIILVGLPKSGTTSIYRAFNSIGLRSAHYGMNFFEKRFCGNNLPIQPVTVHTRNVSIHWGKVEKTNGCYVGLIMQRTLSAGRPLLSDLIDLGFHVFAQSDCCWPQFGFCIFPQLDALDELTTQYPDAYFIHTRRENSTTHFSSMLAWADMVKRFDKAGLFRRFIHRDLDFGSNMLGDGAKAIDAINEFIRLYFIERPHLRFLSVNIESVNITESIRRFVGLSSIKKYFVVGHFNKRAGN